MWELLLLIAVAWSSNRTLVTNVSFSLLVQILHAAGFEEEIDNVLVFLRNLCDCFN